MRRVLALLCCLTVFIAGAGRINLGYAHNANTFTAQKTKQRNTKTLRFYPEEIEDDQDDTSEQDHFEIDFQERHVAVMALWHSTRMTHSRPAYLRISLNRLASASRAPPLKS